MKYSEMDVLQAANIYKKIFAEEDCKIVIYGTGNYCISVLRELDNSFTQNVIAFCDSDTRKHDDRFYGKKILSPRQLESMDFDFILIASTQYKSEIENSLVHEYNMSVDRISVLLTPKQLGFIRECAQPAQKIYVFCAPDYGNLGDHAIMEAEHRFFKAHMGLEVIEIPTIRYDEFAQLAKVFVQPKDIVAITGGGFLGSLWFSMETMSRQVIQNYPNNPVVILPQTLYWESGADWANEKEETRRIYASHPNLILCARDKETQRLMQKAYPECRTILAPDMALSYDWAEYFDGTSKRKGCLLCLKTDKESVLSSNGWEKLGEIGRRLCGSAEVCTTNIPEYTPIEMRTERLNAKIREFRAAELVITDRLHGLIFAVVTGTPCIALNNCNHKLHSTFEWVEHVPNVRFANCFSEVRKLAEDVLRTGYCEFDVELLQECFHEIKDWAKSDYERKEIQQSRSRGLC